MTKIRMSADTDDIPEKTRKRSDWLREHILAKRLPKTPEGLAKLCNEAQELGITVLAHRPPGHLLPDKMSFFDPDTDDGPDNDGNWYEWKP